MRFIRFSYRKNIPTLNEGVRKLGIPKYYVHKWGYVKAYWNATGSSVFQLSITNERLVQAGYYSIFDRYESLHLCD